MLAFCGTAEGPRRAVPSCAGVYVPGAVGSNECPAGYAWIVTEDACRTAAAAAGKTVLSGFVVAIPDDPRGCYFFTAANYAFFNSDPVGAGNSYYQLLCAASATAGAPPAAPMHTRRAAAPRLTRYGTVCRCTDAVPNGVVLVRCTNAVWASTRPAG